MKVLIAYYSKYGHTLKMARVVEEGVKSAGRVEAVLRKIQEFPEVEKELMNDPYGKPVLEAQKDIPVCTLDDLREADGIVIGSPTRFGNMTAQVKNFVDSTGKLWMEGSLEGKPVGFFTSTATTHGGQETTLLTMMVPFIHLGMLIVGVPYSTAGMLHTEGRGGTPYGASTTAGTNNALKPAEEDLNIARALGKRIAETAKKLRS